MRHLLAACLLIFAGPALAAAPSRIVAEYEVYKGGIRIVAMTETFIRKDDHYTLESISKAIGLLALIKAETIRATSTGSITALGLRPEHYASTRTVDSDRNTRADFDWTKHQVTLAYHGGVHAEPLSPGTQDRLSAMYQLMFLPLDSMTELKLLMYNNGTHVDDYLYQILGKTTLTVPAGTFQALYLATVPEKDGKRTEIWVDADRHFPCKLVVTERDGGKYTQVLTRVTFVQ